MTIYDRKGKDAIAVDAFGREGFGPGPDAKPGFDMIPMWVADMNFATAPSITAAISERIQHPLFGYFATTDEYYNSIIRWQEVRNGVSGLTKEAIGYENGVLGGVVSALRVLASQGGSVLVHSPTYVGFTGVLKNNGFNIVHSELIQDEEGIWRMDFEDMEKKLREGKIHAAIFCSPHNPCGRVWEKREIEQAMELYKKYDVYVVSDEIWSDILLNGHRHVPTQSVSEDARMRTVALYAPSKTFNLAGLIGSYHIIYNTWLRDRVLKESSLAHYNSLNVLSMHALIGAYKDEGMVWVDELREVLSENVNYAYDFIRANFDGVTLAKPEGTYMLYLDCEGWCRAHEKTMDELLQAGYDVGVAWQDGRPFNRPYAIRMNLALPKAKVEEAFKRLKDFVF